MVVGTLIRWLVRVVIRRLILTLTRGREFAFKFLKIFKLTEAKW